MPLTLTEAAAKHVRTFLHQHGKGEGLRVGVKNTGCSGLMYVVDYADRIGPGDHVFESRGLKIIVDGKSLPYLEGTELDYGRYGLNEGFRFNNPNVKNACGCGESFNI